MHGFRTLHPSCFWNRNASSFVDQINLIFCEIKLAQSLIDKF